MGTPSLRSKSGKDGVDENCRQTSTKKAPLAQNREKALSKFGTTRQVVEKYRLSSLFKHYLNNHCPAVDDLRDAVKERQKKKKLTSQKSVASMRLYHQAHYSSETCFKNMDKYSQIWNFIPFCPFPAISLRKLNGQLITLC